MQIYRSGEVDYVGGTKGGFIFPGFQMGTDAMYTTVKILEMMAQTKTRFGDMRQRFDKFHRDFNSVPCPWSKKGTVMRQLISNTVNQERQLIDGVRIFEEGGWVLVTPDRATASFSIYVETTDEALKDKLLDKYTDAVDAYQQM